MTFNKDRRGFTLIEVLIALAITALIVSVVTMSIFQVFGGQFESITLTWMDLDGNVHQVRYTIEGDRLQRSHSVNDEEPSESIVAKNIDLNDCTFTDGALALTITATSQEASETREYEIMPRPSF